ncbi:MAG: hypothetical protein L0Z62_36020 [Gemmataceae bacterium]|nr:hypothetical protein [Gemmataceae bacterium]
MGGCASRAASTWWRFTLGLALAAGLMLALAETYLRLFPPRDLHPYLGEDSPLTGLYAADPDFAVTYRSWDAFAADNSERLAPHLPLAGHPDRRPVWAFFGNSFVQAPGMLADTARAALPSHRIFHLGRNEPLFVRFAQVKLLLENGLGPERVLVLIMPLDLGATGSQPLATIRVNPRGALVYEPRYPGGPLGWLVRSSQTAFTAWARSGRHRGNPSFHPRTLCRTPQERLLNDARQLFGNLARITRARGVPVTVLLVPAHEQIMGREGFGMQDALTPMLREHGLDVCDVREAFVNASDRPGLFLPDKHFNERGNQLLLSELLGHLRRQNHDKVTR